MSTTRSQKRKNFQQENSENVSDGFASPVVVGDPCFSENVRENVEEEVGNESKSFYTPTRLVRISSTQNDQDISRNMVTGVLNDSTNQPKRTKVRSQSQPPSKDERLSDFLGCFFWQVLRLEHV